MTGQAMTGQVVTPEFSALAEAVSEMVWTATCKGQWEYVNTRWCDYTGMSVKDSLGDGWLSTLHKEDYDRVQQQWSEGCSGHDSFQLEYRIRSADGIYRWFKINAQPLDTRYSRWSITAADPTKISSAHYDSDAQFHDLANTAPTMLWVTDTHHLCTFISRGWYLFTGQTRAEALGVAWAEAAHPDDRQRVTQTFLQASLRREAFQREYRLRTVDGDYRWVLDAGRPRIAPDGEF